MEEGEDSMEVKRTFERKLNETLKEKEDIKNDLKIAREEVDCLFTLMIDCRVDDISWNGHGLGTVDKSMERRPKNCLFYVFFKFFKSFLS